MTIAAESLTPPPPRAPCGSSRLGRTRLRGLEFVVNMLRSRTECDGPGVTQCPEMPPVSLPPAKLARIAFGDLCCFRARAWPPPRAKDGAAELTSSVRVIEC